jgi:peptidoglycan/LPS O-acetylase OafA/YrhL
METELSPTAMGHSKRLDGIDLLRGLAIFFVLVEHVHIRLALAKVPYTKFLPAQLWHFLVGNGELGVQIFFAVSGLLALRLCFSYCSRYSAACILPMFPTTS